MFNLSSFRAAAVMLATAGVLSACATGPIVHWTVPPPVAQPSKTLDDALSTLGAARAEYERVLLEQTSASQRLGNALIVGGALATGLAVSGAHSDAIVGVGLLGGTAYALGGFNIDQRRWLIYQSAIESFDCARTAAEPANMLFTDRNALASALEGAAKALASAELAMSIAQSQAESEGNVNKDKAELVLPVKARLKALEASIAAARASLSQGQSLLSAVDRTPDRLVAAVRSIDNSARRALISTIPDRNAALAAVADVAKGAAGITPGAGTDTRFKDSLEAFNKSKPQSAAGPSRLSAKVLDSVDQVELAVAALATHVAVIDNLLARHHEAVQKQSLAACNLGELAALSIAPVTLTLAQTDAPAFVLIQGGKPPYAAQASVGSAMLTLQGPVRNDTHFAVSLGASSVAGKAYQVLVLDSSTPPQTALLTVTSTQEIGALGGRPTTPASTPPSTFARPPAPTTPPAVAPGPPGGAIRPAAPAPAASTPADAGAASPARVVDGMGPFTMPDTSRISLAGTTQVDAAGKLAIRLDCKRPAAPAPACFPQKDLRDGVKLALAGKVDPAAIDAATLTTRPPGCVCP